MFGVPQWLISDNGRQFELNLFENLLQKYGVNHQFTPKYHPQPNASERTNRSILNGIRAYIGENHKDWDKHMNEIAHAIRNVKHNSHQYSPNFLVFGQYPVTHASQYDLLDKLNELGGNFLNIEANVDRLTTAQSAVLNHMKKSYEPSAS